MKHKILIVDDEDIFRNTISDLLANISNFDLNILQAKLPDDALSILEINNDIECILLDYNFEKWGGSGQMNGLELAEKIKAISPHIPIIMISEVSDRGSIAMSAAKVYIYDFLDKPFDKDKLINKLKLIFKSNKIVHNIEYYEKAQDILFASGFHSVSKVMQKVCMDAFRAALSDDNVLILGETGTGKTHLASVIHNLSNRHHKQFIDCNIASLKEELIESELFGHKKGAFTGSIEDKKGLLEIVEDGTLLLDEISELPLNIQAKLLYPLGEQKSFSPVGKQELKLKFKARVITATNVPLEVAIEKKLIRDDILPRLPIKIRIPPLREHIEDLDIYVKKFIDEHNHLNGSNYVVESRALALMKRQPWIGNIRQVKNFINKCVVSCKLFNIETISIDIVQSELADIYNFSYSPNEYNINKQIEFIIADIISNIEMYISKKIREDGKGGIKEILRLFEKELLTQILELHNGNQSAAAQSIFENLDTLRYRLKQHDLIQ